MTLGPSNGDVYVVGDTGHSVIEKFTAEWRIRPGVAVDDSESLDQAIGGCVCLSTRVTR
jgi:hypothetical protein